MNIKMKVTARTAHSEEWAIFDADTRDEREQAVNIGKLDVHYVDDQIVGTLLIWAEYVTNFTRTRAESGETITDVIDEILAEISEPATFMSTAPGDARKLTRSTWATARA